MMCAEDDEERLKLLQLGTPSKAPSKHRGGGAPASSAAWERYKFAALSAAVVLAAFAAGYHYHASYAAPMAADAHADANADANAASGAPAARSPLALFDEEFTEHLVSGMVDILDRNNGTVKHYRYDSPFEHRWPGDVQPHWARKRIPFHKAITPDKQVCFVHIGKAGGSSRE